MDNTLKTLVQAAYKNPQIRTATIQAVRTALEQAPAEAIVAAWKVTARNWVRRRSMAAVFEPGIQVEAEVQRPDGLVLFLRLSGLRPRWNKPLPDVNEMLHALTDRIDSHQAAGVLVQDLGTRLRGSARPAPGPGEKAGMQGNVFTFVIPLM